MEIINANTLKAKGDLMALIEKTNGTLPKEIIDQWLTYNLGTDVFGAWIAVEKELVGMVLCELVEPHDPKIYIAFNYQKDGVDANAELFKRVEQWAKEKDIHKLIIYAKHHPQTYIKKHGFRLVQTVLDKEI